jgi:hypothetical protein
MVNKHGDLRSRCGLSSFGATGLAISLTVLLNIGWVEGQRVAATVVPTTVVPTTVVLAVVLSILAVVLTVLAIVLTVLPLLTVVAALALALTELSIGDTGCKQHGDES